MRRVVVTGLGLVTPLATGVEETWSRILAGQSGAGPITRFDASAMACQVACEVKRGDGTNGTFNADHWMEPKDQRRYDDFILYAVAASEQAIRDSGWQTRTDEEQCRTGVLVGSGIGGLPSIEATSICSRRRDRAG
jgi:3-oxoacyl-[acyl-carrier-protein] synthase II